MKQRIESDCFQFELHSNLSGLRYVAGADVSFCPCDASNPFEEYAVAGVVVLEWPSLDPVYEKFEWIRLTVPYIPGYLAFREAPSLIPLIQSIPDQWTPQLIMVDGNGKLHYRQFGLACHIGVLTGIPTIGIGKNFLALPEEGPAMSMKYVKSICREKLHKMGDHHILEGKSGVVYGAAVIPTSHTHNPIFVSVGHGISLESAIQITCQLSRFRVPEPIRQADIRSREFIRSNPLPVYAV